MHTITISASGLTAEAVVQALKTRARVAISADLREAVVHCRRYLDQKIQSDNALFYGINTGFGALCNVRIAEADVESLQHNLVMSHAAGAGAPVPPEIVRIMLLLKIQSLGRGHSGVRAEVLDRLADLYNTDLIPVVYELGSLGASGDLAPLAHLSLPLIGLGEVYGPDGKPMPAAPALRASGIRPIRFKAKEALALLNGTQFSSAYALWCLHEAQRLLRLANLNAALAYDAFNCRTSPLHPAIHALRPHPGQIDCAAQIAALLEGSEIAGSEKQGVQDPYAFRCAPQVHGASAQAIAHVSEVVHREINSVTDNPNIFPDQDLILSGGNFHAQPLALPLDYLTLAMSELGSISERRTFQLIGGQRGLPPFLTDDPGLHSGLMIAQYTAAAISSQNKTLCMPASADSIVSCNGQEDHVSMAANAGLKAKQVAENLERLLAIEWMTAAQALEYRRPLRSSPAIEALHAAYRERVPRLKADRVLQPDIETTIQFLRDAVQV
ncbi:MAG: histidine ammonia-lyase [Saprospiraceae bacterium]